MLTPGVKHQSWSVGGVGVLGKYGFCGTEPVQVGCAGAAAADAVQVHGSHLMSCKS